MPRGAIHQAEALPEEHSLHVTVSVNQMRTWADFLETALPVAMTLAIDECTALRRATPVDFTEYAMPLALHTSVNKLIFQIFDCGAAVSCLLHWLQAAWDNLILHATFVSRLRFH